MYKRQELERLLQDGITEEELTRSKENVKGRAVLSLESTATRMSRLGASIINGVPVLSVDELIERIDAVSLDDLRELARELFAPDRLSAAGVGNDEARFRSALEPVSSSLAGA